MQDERSLRVAAIKAAVRAQGVLLKDANRCPSYSIAIKGDAKGDAGVVATKVLTFIDDQAKKSVWLRDWSGSLRFDGVTMEATRLADDPNVDSETAKAVATKWAEGRQKSALRHDILNMWLRARCHLPAHAHALATGLQMLKIGASNNFYQSMSRILATSSIVLAELQYKGAISICKLDRTHRRSLHKGLSDSKKYFGIVTFSTGPESSRVMHIISDKWWDGVLELPLALIKMHILPRAFPPIVVSNSGIMKPRRAPSKAYWCGECGIQLDKDNVLVSVYHIGIWCQECVDGDPDVCDSKWENL